MTYKSNVTKHAGCAGFLKTICKLINELVPVMGPHWKKNLRRKEINTNCAPWLNMSMPFQSQQTLSCYFAPNGAHKCGDKGSQWKLRPGKLSTYVYQFSQLQHARLPLSLLSIVLSTRFKSDRESQLCFGTHIIDLFPETPRPPRVLRFSTHDSAFEFESSCMLKPE